MRSADSVQGELGKGNSAWLYRQES